MSCHSLGEGYEAARPTIPTHAVQSSSAYTSLAAGFAGCYPLALRLGASRHGSLYFPYVGLYIKTKIPCMKHRVRAMK